MDKMKGVKVDYLAAALGFIWLKDIWFHLVHIPYQNQLTLSVDVITDFDKHRLMDWIPTTVYTDGGWWTKVERPFAVENSRLHQLDFTAVVGEVVDHAPGDLGRLLSAYQIDSPEFIVRVSMRGIAQPLRMQIFVMNPIYLFDHDE